MPAGPTPLGSDADRRQILEPALGLHEALDLGRHRPRVEVVDDKDHHRLAALELVGLGQQAEPVLFGGLVEICSINASVSGLSKSPQFGPLGDQYVLPTSLMIALTGSSRPREKLSPSYSRNLSTPAR